MPTRFDIAYAMFAPVAMPWVAWRWARRGKYKESGPGMIGRHLPEGDDAKVFASGSIWIHAVSVGEVAAARTLIPGLRERFPQMPLVISTITETGQAAAKASIEGADAFTYFPLDLSGNVGRFLDAYNPRIVIILEAEIWPNFLTLAKRRGAAIFQVNGKMSDRSFPRYRSARKLARPIFDAFDGFCVQTPVDGDRYGALNVNAERVSVTGNVKFDLDVPQLSVEERAEIRASWGLGIDQPVIVAGSTHEGEEELLFAALAKVRETVQDCALIMAPRHPERFDTVWELAKAAGYCAKRATDLEADGAGEAVEVVILNKMGVLARSYGVGDVSIVAGSFGPVGGHNLLEAAAHSVPVVYGPNMKSQREIAHLFASAKAGTQTEPEDLADVLTNLLRDDALRKAEGEKCLQVLIQNQGSAGRSLDAISNWMSGLQSGV